MKQSIDTEVFNCHKTWHKFSNWMEKTFGQDLFGEWQDIQLFPNGKKFKHRDFNELEFNNRIAGYEVLCKIEKYVKRYCPEIKIVRCDDDSYSGSDILLIPHPTHGITVLFIPQCTTIQNKFFLYQGHYNSLLKALKEMKYVYKDK